MPSQTSPPPDSAPVEVREHPDRTVVTLNRPAKLNALTRDMLDTIREATQQLAGTSQVRPVVVRSMSNRAFSVGADLGEWEQLDPAGARQASLAGMAAFDALESLDQPVIAEIDGHCLGGGLELALAADVRIASTEATFGFPEVTVGTATSWGGLNRLIACVGAGVAKDLLLTGETLSAEQAHQIGLITRVAEPAHLAAAVDELVERLCATAPLALREIKRMVDAVSRRPADRELESMSAALFAATTDAAEGKAAFRQRRTAQYEGR